MDALRTRTLANDWLKDFCLALKNVALYSAEHPRGREYLDRAYESLRAAMEDRREAVLSRTESRLYLDQILLDRERGLAQQLAEEMEARGVETLVLHATLTPEEHLGLVRCLLTKPDRVAEKGGFGPLLLDEGVSSVKGGSERPPRTRDSTESLLDGELGLIEFILRMSRSGAREAEAAGSEAGSGRSVTSVLARDPAAVARAILSAARGKDQQTPTGPEALAELLADTLERLAERAIEEHQKDREEILVDVGRALVGADPEVHPTLILEKAGPRSIRKNLVAAVDRLSAELIADLVAAHHPRAHGDYRALTEMLQRAAAWRDDRSAAVAAVERRLGALGLAAEDARDLVDHLLWNEISLARRLELIQKADSLWRMDFNRLKDVLIRLLAADQVKEATGLIQKYLGGLMLDDLALRRVVADNARYVLQLIEKTGKGLPMLGRIAELFFTRLQDEQDGDVVSRLAGGLAFLVDLRLRSGELTSALDLMRKTEHLCSSGAPALKERGEKLAEALSRAGNDKMFKKLSEMLLEGSDQSSMEAAEILKRGGGRSANYLIERLAEEENRSHRARLVMLLKEMGKGSSMPFVSRLEDPRWYLVRNVVGILGDIGDPGILPHLRKVAGHGDPRVRREVVRTWARLGTAECEDQIIGVLGDEDRGVQITAVNALATMKGPRAIGVLLDLARKSGPFEAVAPEVRQEALVSLARAGAKEVFPILSDVLARRGFLGHTEPTETRVAAAKALGSIATPEAAAILSELAQKDPRQAVREAAREALQQRAIGGQGAQGVITPPR